MTPEELYCFLSETQVVGSPGVKALRDIEPILSVISHKVSAGLIVNASASPEAAQVDAILSRLRGSDCEQLETPVWLAIIGLTITPLAALRLIIEQNLKPQSLGTK